MTVELWLWESVCVCVCDMQIAEEGKQVWWSFLGWLTKLGASALLLLLLLLLFLPFAVPVHLFGAALLHQKCHKNPFCLVSFMSWHYNVNPNSPCPLPWVRWGVEFEFGTHTLTHIQPASHSNMLLITKYADTYRTLTQTPHSLGIAKTHKITRMGSVWGRWRRTTDDDEWNELDEIISFFDIYWCHKLENLCFTASAVITVAVTATARAATMTKAGDADWGHPKSKHTHPWNWRNAKFYEAYLTLTFTGAAGLAFIASYFVAAWARL